MNIFGWNFSGVGCTHFSFVLCMYIGYYNLDIVAIFEPHISGSHANSVVESIKCITSGFLYESTVHPF